ncbi:MAG: hypothetical protein IJO45_02625 [Oscillospiraceae bacterium]|nr:hypothetical protein [Oscillospiraceae bacterium]
MAEYAVVKRVLLVIASMLGCVLAFGGVMVGVGMALLLPEEQAVFTLSDEQLTTEPMSLPCRVEGTALIASQLVMYEGPFLETGGDTPVSDITALILYNSGEREIAQAEVVLAGEEELTFFASNIMPGAKVLVLEKNAAAWEQRELCSCSGWVNESGQELDLEDSLEIREVDMGTLSITNISREKLEDIWLYYKNYVPEGDLYVGGITYLEVIESLEPGQTVQINPAHYAAGYSRILKAEVIS